MKNNENNMKITAIAINTNVIVGIILTFFISEPEVYSAPEVSIIFV
jgi:hypothetical protein